MAVRACGHGLRVGMIQFIKSQDNTGELAAAESLPHLYITQAGRGWVPQPDTREFHEHQEAAQRGLARARDSIPRREWDMLVLDEICVAISKGLLREDAVLGVISEAPDDMIIVLTGRNAPEGLIQRADTITEMRCLRHALQKGRKAQQGVEY